MYSVCSSVPFIPMEHLNMKGEKARNLKLMRVFATHTRKLGGASFFGAYDPCEVLRVETNLEFKRIHSLASFSLFYLREGGHREFRGVIRLRLVSS